jgi:cardiolipin synthase
MGGADLLDANLIERFRPRPVDGNQVVLLQSGAEFFPSLIAAIDAAQREVWFETYIFAGDETGLRVAAALARAAERGVAVRVTVDGFGTRMMPEPIARRLADAGVLLMTYAPVRRLFTLDRERLRRLHRKQACIDARVAFVGGLNVLDDLWDPNHGALEHPRLDYAVRLHGPLVASVHASMVWLWRQVSVARLPHRFVAGRWRRGGALGDGPEDEAGTADPAAGVGDRWTDAGGGVGGGATAARGAPGSSGAVGAGPEPHLRPDAAPGPNRSGRRRRRASGGADGVRAMHLLRDNLVHRRSIERAYLKAIGNARREVLIANAYFLPGRRFRRALVSAAGRGVRVRLLVQGRAEYLLPRLAEQSLYDVLLRAGVEIVEYHRSFLHAKVAVIDDWATVGSSNIDPFSLLLSREANVMVFDARFAAQLRARLLASMVDGGRPVLAAEHARRSWMQRLRGWCAYRLLRLGVVVSGARRRY